MIYTWRCKECKNVIELEATVQNRNDPPRSDCSVCGASNSFVRVILSAPSVPFESLKGTVFMDDHGNYPPRKI